MKAMVCEMCYSNDLVKQNGMYICQYCGTKYSVEEARKLIVEGTIKIDYSDELTKLYEIARRARDTDNSENAQKFYEQILLKDPSNWEPNFYSTYYQSMNGTIAEIQLSAHRITNAEKTILMLVLNTVEAENEKKNVVNEIGLRLIEISKMLFIAAKNHYESTGYAIRDEYTQEYVNNGSAARDILYTYGDLVTELFGREFAKDIAIPCWQEAINEHKILLPKLTSKKVNKSIIKNYTHKIQTYCASADEQPAERKGVSASEKQPVEGKEYLLRKKPLTQSEETIKKQGILRKSMKIWMIICFVLAGIYALVSFTDPTIIAMTGFFGILGIMFMLLGFSPKGSKYMFGKPTGIKKSLFVLFCVVLAFILVVTVVSSMQNM